MEEFLSNYLLTIVFWSFVLVVIGLVIGAGIKTPKPKTMPLNAPTKFVGKVSVDEAMRIR